ncbi:MAG: BON domain-containing protein [Chitinispirillaceae bacterium]
MAYTDEEVRRLVMDQLEWDGRLSNSQVDVRVQSGQVTLEGKVNSFTARQAAESDALLVPEVVRVIDHTVIEFPGGAEGLTDEDIRSSVLNRFLWNPNISVSDIDVKVEKGSVTLEGSVDGYWKKVRAEEVAYDIKGVVKVHNELAVVPSHEYGDREIAESIVNALHRGGKVDVERLELQVENGIATVGGSMGSMDEYNEVVHAVKFTRGVREVNNMLKVRKGTA